MSPDDDRSRDRLMKVLRMLASDQPGEREGAAHAAHRLLMDSKATIDELLAPKVQVRVSMTDDDNVRRASEHAREWQARADEEAKRRQAEEKRAAEAAERAQAEERRADEKARAERDAEKAKYRRSVIAKYGSVKAAKADNERERAINAAGEPLVRKVNKTYANGTFERDTLDGWSGWCDPMPVHVAKAIKDALPFPTTIAEAIAEYEYWHERNRELKAIYNCDYADTMLSLACSARQELVWNASRYEIRAMSLEDALARCHALAEDGDIEEAVLADLEGLLAQSKRTANPAPATFGTATRTYHLKGNGRQPTQSAQPDLFGMEH